MNLSELFNKQNVDYQITKSKPEQFSAEAEINNRKIVFSFFEDSPGVWELAFYEDKYPMQTSKLTGNGGEFEVFALVKKFLLEAIERYSPEEVYFTGKDRQGDFYSRVFKKFKVPGYEFKEQNSKNTLGKFWKFELIKNVST